MITYEELEKLAEKVDQGTATEVEELLFLETLNKGFDELIERVEQQNKSQQADSLEI